MDKELQVYLNDMLSLTGTPEWETLMLELKKEIYQAQANLLQNAQTWDAVVFQKGWCSALAYIINTRETTKATLDQAEDAKAAEAEDNADV